MMTRAQIKAKLRAGEYVTGVPEELVMALTEELQTGATGRDAEPVTLMESTGSPHERLRRAALQESAWPTSRVKDDAVSSGPGPTYTDDAVGLFRQVAARLGVLHAVPPARRKPFVYADAPVVLAEGAHAKLAGGPAATVPEGAHARLLRACGGGR